MEATSISDIGKLRTILNQIQILELFMLLLFECWTHRMYTDTGIYN